jgi:hypothetical protein
MRIPILLLVIFSTASFADESLVQYSSCPVSHWTCWLGTGDDFEKMPWTQDIAFDPTKAFPQLSDADKAHPLSWVTTPSNYCVLQEPLIRIGDHHIWRIEYFCHDPSNKVQQQAAIILMWDYRPFCITFGDAYVDHPEVSTDMGIIDSKSGLLIDVGQYLSGTGAYNVHARFSFGSNGPVLKSVVRGGRDH